MTPEVRLRTTGTCDGCGKRRKLTYPPNKDEELFYNQGRRILLSSKEYHERQKLQIHYYALCSDCLPKVQSRDDLMALRRARKASPPRVKKAFPILGGELDGEYAITDDFGRDGIYEHLESEYFSFNGSGYTGKSVPSMVYIHRSLLKPTISGRDR